jgi:monoamine oxidase
VKRRKAIKQLGLGLSAGIAMPAWLASCKSDEIKPEIQYDGVVAIIGAGAAGLYAADILHTKGIKVKVFEASDRIGGRVRSLRLADSAQVETDFPIELGAERIIGTDSLWSRIIDEIRIPAIELGSVNSGFIIDNTFQLQNEIESDSDYAQAKSFFENIANQTSSNLSVDETIVSNGISERTKAILNAWIGGKNGSSNDKISMMAIAEAATLKTSNVKRTDIKKQSNAGCIDIKVQQNFSFS